MKKQLTDQELDAFLKGKLQNLNSEVPTSFWNEIDAQIPTANQAPFRKNKLMASVALSAVAIAAAAAVTYTVISLSQQNEEVIIASEQATAKLRAYVADSIQQDSLPQIDNSLVHTYNTINIPQVQKLTIDENAFAQIQNSNNAPLLVTEIKQADTEPEPISAVSKTITEEKQENDNPILDTSASPISEQLSLDPKPIVESDTADEQLTKDLIPQKNPKDRKWRFGAYFSPSYSYRMLDDVDKYYYDLIESSAFAWNASLELSYQINSKFSVSSAIDIEQYSLKTEVYAANAYLSLNDELAYIMGSYGYTPCGLTVIQNSNTDFIQSTCLYYLSIPLQVQYDVYKSFFVRAGLNYSLLVGTHTNSHLGKDDLYSNAAYLRRNNFGLILSAGKEISINDKFSVIIAPQFRIRLQSMLDDVDFNSNAYMLGLNIGLRY